MSPSRFTSRKFLTTLTTQLTAIAVLLWPAHQAAIEQAGPTLAALAVLVLSSLGYLAAEGAVDRARATRGGAAGERGGG